MGNKRKRIMMAVMGTVLGVLTVVLAVTCAAYFSKKEIYDGYLSGEVELLFDHLSDKGKTAYYEAANITVPDGTDPSWGSAENPYVISDVRHLYNLSELQRLGFFYKKYISVQEDGSYTNIPYFLVCTPEYTPVLIDGTQFKGITSIGTDEYPFIGSICGVESTDATVTVNGKTCDTSVLYNITVSGNPANADVGLFGNVGYLGEAPESGSFSGQVSTLSNLVLVDVQVTVNSTLWDTVTAFLEYHHYSYSDLAESDKGKVPHENHHIGILAGHASYAVIEYISVYYTSDDIVAMDLSDATVVNGDKANYLSSTGILGFADNINPVIKTDGNGNQSISKGSGDSSSDLSYSTVGGGGATSGNQAGYVLAVDMYTTYHYKKEGETITEDSDGTIILKDAVDAGGNALCTEWIRDRLLWGTEATGRYYFYDGVFTFALSSQEDVIEPTWNGDADTFSIGQNDSSKWQTNYSQGNNAVVAYVNKITTNAQLNAAISEGKQIFIMQEGMENIFLMSLYSQSVDGGSGNFETKYSTPGVSKQFGDAAFVQSIIDSYNGGKELSDDITLSKEELISALQGYIDNPTGSNFRVINVGITSSSVDLDTLKAQYKITANTTGHYSYFDEKNNPVQVNDDGTLNEYYVYPINNGEITDGYDGYFYYTESKKTVWGVTTITYTYYWQSYGEVAQIGTGEYQSYYIFGQLQESKTDTPAQFFGETTNIWNNEGIYTHTYEGKELKGVVVNKSEGSFYATSSEVNANGDNLTKPSDQTIGYFYCDIGKTDYYHATDTNKENKIEDSSFTDTGNTSLAGQKIYRANGQEGVKLTRYPTYTFSAQDENKNTNYMRILQATFSNHGVRYALWNGTDDYLKDNQTSFQHNFTILGFPQTAASSSVDNNKEATLFFDDSSGTCYIQYSIGSVGLYVNSTGSAFNTATSNSEEGAKLCIYTVEGTQDLNYGRVTFDPIDDETNETDCYTFSSGEYVLFATPTHTKDTNGAITGTSTAYTVTSIADLGWNNGSGQGVSSADLQKKFRMIKGITFGTSFNLGGGTLGTEGIITAPVGSEGVEANIPQSCIAFRINKASSDNKIRVIVSVAVSEFYPGEEGYDLGDYTRYFNLWKMEAAGESTVQVFDATGDNLLDRIEIPRSHPYQPGMTPGDASSEYITVIYGDNKYRCYLNGDRVLIAYEFTVDTTDTGVGVYCLGMSGIDGNGDVVADVPMEIVYFSADGVASAGRDGVSNSQIGSIDFVYDDGNKIVTVEENSSTDPDGNEDYSTYYPSYCLLYFDTAQKDENSSFVSVNSEKVRIRRYVIDEGITPASSDGYITTTSRSTIKIDFRETNYTKISQYSNFADNIEAIKDDGGTS